MDIKSQVWANSNKKVFVNDNEYENFSWEVWNNPLGDLGKAIGWNPSLEDIVRPDRQLNNVLTHINMLTGSNLSALTSDQKQQRADQARDAVNSTWQIDPVKENDCAYLQDRLKKLGTEMDAFLAKNPGTTDIERTYSVMVEKETQYKNKVSDLKCVEKQQDAKKEADIQRIMEEQKKAYKEELPTTGLEKKPQAPSTTSKATNYVLIGVGVIALAIIGSSMFK